MAISTVSYVLTPQAKDDSWSFNEEYFNTNSTVILDVMANDLGGKAKTLYSIDNGDALKDLLTQDPNLSTEWEPTANGNAIRINNGKIEFKLADSFNVNTLSQGESSTDTFTYAIRLGNGTLSVATVKITLVGENDNTNAQDDNAGSVLENAVISGNVSSNDTDIDGLDTHVWNIVDGSFKDSEGNVVQGSLTMDADGNWSYDAQGSYDSLMDGDTVNVSFDYTMIDNHGASSTATVSFTIVGVGQPEPEVEKPVNTEVTYIFNSGIGFPATGSDTLTNFDSNDTIKLTGFSAGTKEVDSVTLTSGNFGLGDAGTTDTMLTVTEINTSSGKTTETVGYVADYTFTDTTQIVIVGTQTADVSIVSTGTVS